MTLMHIRAAKSRPQLGPESFERAARQRRRGLARRGCCAQRAARALYRILDTLSDKKRATSSS